MKFSEFKLWVRNIKEETQEIRTEETGSNNSEIIFLVTSTTYVFKVVS